MKNEQTNKSTSWQMAGVTPRTTPVGGWMFAPATDCPQPATVSHRPTALPSALKTSSRRMSRMLPALAVVGALTTLLGGVAVARYPHHKILPSDSAYPMNVAVTVQSGDTLWSLAKHYGSEERYILDQVDEIAQANSMSSRVALLPGQRVWIPAHNDTERTFITARRLTR